MDILLMPDGAILASDDRDGAIYRISFVNCDTRCCAGMTPGWKF